MANQGRVVLLTGAAGGIGRVMTQALLADGHRVAAVDRDASSLEKLKAQCGRHERLYPVLAELGHDGGCRRAVAATRERFGTIEAVINNAGIGMSSIRPDAEARPPGIEEIRQDTFDAFMQVFVRAPAIIVRLALPMMKASGFGRIVNNTTSYLTMLRVLPYGAAKAALESMSAVWAKEVEGSAITVNVLVPDGPTDTPMISNQAGWPREKMLRPEIMGPPTLWLTTRPASMGSGSRPPAGTPRFRPRRLPSAPVCHG